MNTDMSSFQRPGNYIYSQKTSSWLILSELKRESRLLAEGVLQERRGLQVKLNWVGKQAALPSSPGTGLLWRSLRGESREKSDLASAC